MNLMAKLDRTALYRDNLMVWIQLFFRFLGRRRSLQVDRIFLALALCMALGAIVSARYHFFMQNYSPFVMQQVLPATGKMPWAEKALWRAVPLNRVPTARLDTWPWDSPLFRNQHHQYGEALIPIGSDYLGVWHYTRMLLCGMNPYDINFYFTYNFQAYNWPMMKDPKVPAQIVGPLSYPPFAAMVLVPFYSDNYFLSLFKYYLAFGTFLVLGSAWILRRASQARLSLAMLLGTMILTSYPIAMILDRGNIEGILFIFTTLGVIAYLSKRFYLSALLIALAACCKFYPAIFFMMFILDRNWKPLLFGVLSIVGVTLVSFIIINSPVSHTLSMFFSHLGGINEFFLYDGRSIQFSHTLCTLVSGILFSEVGDPKVQSMLRTFCGFYPYMIGILTLGACLRMRRLDALARVSALTVMMVFFPFFSYDYTLIYLFLPFGLLLVEATQRSSWSLMDVLPLALFGFISIPKQYLVGLFAMGPGIGFALNGLALGTLLILTLIQRKPAIQEPDLPRIPEINLRQT